MALLQRFSLVTLLLMLVACGGGEGGFGAPTPDPEPVPDPNGISGKIFLSNQNISDDNPATLTVTVLKGTEPQQNVLVTFKIEEGGEELAHFTPEAGTSITDPDGVATIILNAGSVAGAGTINISFTASGTEITEQLNFNSAGDANTGTTINVDDITLFASSPQIASSGAQEVTLTAIAKNNNNNLLENVEISFAASSGQIQVIKAVTGPDGQASALLKTSNTPMNRIINVTAETAGVNDTVDVQVVGTTVQLTGSSSLALNDANDFIVKVLDSDGNGIANQLVVLSIEGTGAAITLPETVTTDFTGQATASIIGTTGGSNSIKATALGASVRQSVSVQADSFLFSSFSNGIETTQDLTNIPDVLLSDIATVTLTWLRNGAAVPDGTVINFSATRGDLSSTSAATINGQVSTTLTSNNAGKSLVTFSGVEGVIALNNQLEFEFIAETANRIVAQASPHSISPNGQQSTISIVVTDPTGNLVKNKQVDFTLTDISGGSIFPASAVTDSNGNASTVYTSNTVSAQDAVSIRTVVRDTPAVFSNVTLTVADRELFISLGTGNQLEEPDVTSYTKQFSVFVTDVDSTPVDNVELTVSAVPRSYYKGEWIRSYDEGGTFVRWITAHDVVRDALGVVVSYDNGGFFCISEDSNIDGILDLGEDINNNGSLTPGNIVSADGNLITDEKGQAIIDIRYSQSHGSWIDIDLVVSAKVSGTENSNQTTFTLSTLADDILDEDITPPTSSTGVNSPFGRASSCTTDN